MYCGGFNKRIIFPMRNNFDTLLDNGKDYSVKVPIYGFNTVIGTTNTPSGR